jgi:hypothetical protein
VKSAAPPSSSDERRIKKRWWFALAGGNSLLISILLHVLVGVAATYLIVEHFQKKHVNFHATEPPTQHTEVEHKIELAQKNNVESAPPDLKRITTTDISSITLPDVPDIPNVQEDTTSAMSGVAGELGTGLGGGGAGNGAGGGGGIPPLFGAPEGPGLVGTLYDMKQTSTREPTPMAAAGDELTTPDAVNGWFRSPATQAELRVLRSFIVDWDPAKLEDYYQAPVVLKATQFFIPKLSAEEAPKAFQVEATVQPRRWIVHYEGKIIPPETGDFRFIGVADDFLVVRVDGNNVLDGSYSLEKLQPSANVKENVGTGPAYLGEPLYCGPWISMNAGLAVDMEVLIGEGPGGESSFFLFVQEKGDGSALGDYPVFQLKEGPVRSLPGSWAVPPGYTNKKMVFKSASE